LLDGCLGINGYILEKAGSDLLQDFKEFSKTCRPGHSTLCQGYNLPARHVLQTVGPQTEDPRVLEKCYKNSLDCLVLHGLRTIAFPCLATGNIDYPLKLSTQVALNTIHTWLEQNLDKVDKIVLVTFKLSQQAIYELLLPVYFPVPNGKGSNCPVDFKSNE